MDSKERVSTSIIIAIFLTIGCAFSRAQSNPDAPKPAASQDSARSLESLNMPGGDAAMPPFSESVVDVNSSFRRGLLSKGMALRLISSTQFANDILKAAAPVDQQAFVGDTPFGGEMLNPIFTADLRQLGLKHAQLNISDIWQWISCQHTGPKVLDLWTLYFYQEFGKDRVEIKTGYDSNDLEFVGMQGLYVGASAMTAASRFNPCDSYFEARLHKMAPFAKRPGDDASVLSTYTGYSKYFTDPLVAGGASVWRNSGSLTESYNIHLAPGNFLSLGLSYIRGAAITPHISDTITFAANYSLFF